MTIWNKKPMSEPSKNQRPDNPLAALESWLRTLIREEIQAASNGNERLEGELLTAEKVAERWGVKVSKVRDLARRGELPCVRLGHYMRFRPEDLDQFAKERIE